MATYHNPSSFGERKLYIRIQDLAHIGKVFVCYMIRWFGENISGSKGCRTLFCDLFVVFT